MATMAPWIFYKLLVQDSVYRQMQVANSLDVTLAMALIRASVAARHTEASGTEHRAPVRLDSANRPRALNRLESTIQQMQAGAAAVPATIIEVQRLFGRLDNSTRRKGKRTTNLVAEQQPYGSH
jgi:hypothetical protein